jgi:hypothetical protein
LKLKSKCFGVKYKDFKLIQVPQNKKKLPNLSVPATWRTEEAEVELKVYCKC